MSKSVKVNKEAAAELKALRQIKKDYERLKIEHALLKKAIEFTSTKRAISSSSSKPIRSAKGLVFCLFARNE